MKYMTEIWEIKWEDLKYKTKNYKYDFKQYKTIRSFGESIYTCKASIIKVEKEQGNLLENIVKFKNKSRPRSEEDKEKKRYLWKCICSLWRLRINS